MLSPFLRFYHYPVFTQSDTSTPVTSRTVESTYCRPLFAAFGYLSACVRLLNVNTLFCFNFYNNHYCAHGVPRKCSLLLPSRAFLYKSESIHLLIFERMRNALGTGAIRPVLPQLFQVLPNFHESVFNLIGTLRTCFLFLLENIVTAKKRKKTTCLLWLSKYKLSLLAPVNSSCKFCVSIKL